VADRRVQAATVADAGAIGALAGRAWRAAYTGLLAPDVLASMDPAELRATWRYYLAELPAPDRVWVIEDTGVVCGFARTGPCPDSDVGTRAGEVYGLYVDPDRIGTGLGRELFGHAADDLTDRGRRPLVVWHFAANDRAGRFYERAGFAADGATRASEFGVPEIRRRRPA
jgi:GNAT superfamily N-acetyltransferase